MYNIKDENAFDTIKTDIVVIDSGVMTTHPALKEYKIKGIALTLENNELKVGTDISDKIGHGTAVCSIIKAHSPKSEIYVIKVFDEINVAIGEELLLSVLGFIKKNIQCKIINLSLGINYIKNYSYFYNTCDDLRKMGITIIAAFDNIGGISYPAAFDNVIGVQHSDECINNTDICIVDNSVVNICAKGSSQRVAWINNGYIISGGNSYACAHVSGIIASKAEKCNIDSFNYKYYLTDNTKKRFFIDREYHREMMPPVQKYKNVAIFPFNKEMHSLVRFEHLLKFTITDIYDIKYSSRVGASTNHLLTINSQHDHIIKNIDNIDWDSIDTLIIGHINQMSKLIHRKNWFYNIVEEALKRNKFVYSFDEYIPSNIESPNNSIELIYSPKILKTNININPFGKLHYISKPVVGVFGTSSKQGKFTLQLALRELFLKNRYNIGQIGSEPTSYLFEMNACLHFGYSSTNEITRELMVAYLNDKMNELSLQNVDIIIAGCQSGTITYENSNLNHYTFCQNEFILGLQPDAVILTVNPYDDLEYIIRTISYIESVVDCEVISIAVFPMTLKNAISGLYGGKRKLFKDEFMEIKHNIENKVGKPVYNLDNPEDLSQIFNNILSYFSAN